MPCAQWQPLLERERELGEIHALLEASGHGGGGGLVVVGGVGSGKTALLRAARACCRPPPLLLQAAADETDQGVPFSLVSRLLSDALPTLPAALRRKVSRGSGLATFLTAQRGKKRNGEANTVRGRQKAERFHSLRCFLEELARMRAVVLLLDNLQWADRHTLRLLLALGERLEELPLTLLLATRPPSRRRSQPLLEGILSLPTLPVLVLRPLSRAAVAQLLTEALGAPPAPAFAEEAHRLTAGHPYLAWELGAELARQRVHPTREGLDALRSLACRSLSGTLSLRLNGLGAPARRLAQALAVLEPAGTADRAAALAGLSPARAGEALDRLLDAGFAEQSAGRLALAQPLLRRIVLATLREGKLAALHRRAATLLAHEGAAAELVASHLLAVPFAGNSTVARAQARQTLRAAAADALARGDRVQAARLLRRALVERPPVQERALLLRDLGSAELRAGEAGALRQLRVAARVLQEPRELAVAHLELGLGLLARDALEEAVAVLEQAAERLEPTGPLALRLQAELLAAGRLAGRRGDWLGQRLAAPAPPAGKSAAERLFLGVLAFERMVAALPGNGTTAAEVRSLANRALAGPSREWTAHSPPLCLAAFAAAAADHFPLAAAFFQAALLRAEREGSAIGFGIATCLRAQLALRQGDLPLAEAQSGAYFNTWPSHRWELGRPAAAGYRIEALLGLGRTEEAKATLRANSHLLRRNGLFAIGLRLARGRLTLAGREYAAAAASLLEGGAELCALGVYNPALIAWRSDAGLALWACGQSEQGAALVEEECRLARAFGAPRALGIALQARAQTAHRRELQLAALEEALVVLRQSGALLEQGRAALALGSFLRRQGKRQAAAAMLREALEMGARTGAAPLCEGARAELRAAGLRPRRERFSGVAALTGAEQRVVALAAEGATNREIAQALYVSPRTVETHLRHSYLKLGVRRKGELKAALAAEERVR